MAFQMARHPGVGRQGAKLEVQSNTFEVMAFPKDKFIHYDDFDPSTKPKRAQEVFLRLQLHTAPNMFQDATAFDGAKNMYAYRRDLFNEGSMTFTVNMSDRPPTGPNPRGIYKVTLRKVAEIKPSDLPFVLEGQCAGLPMTTTPLQVLNVLVQQAAALKFPVHAKQKFFAEDGCESLGSFEIWRGFFLSVRPSPKKLLLNVDMATGVMYQRGPLIDFILAYFGLRDARVLTELNEGHPQWSRLKSLLKGVQIIQLPSGRLRTIRSLVPNAGFYEFVLRNGQTTSVNDYFLQHHSLRLQQPRIPGIITNREEVVPLELCRIKEGQIFKKKASPELMAKMLTFSKKRPAERLSVIQTGMQLLQIESSPFIRQAGMKISTGAMSIQGRILEPPWMKYGGQTDKQQPKSGAWNMLGRRLWDPIPIQTWVAVCFERMTKEGIQSVQQFMTELIGAMIAVGMNVGNKQPPIIQANPAQVENELISVCQKMIERTKALPTILIVILPQNSASIRKHVKRFGDVLHGVPTQCIRVDKMRTARNQYHNNLILKINAKLGGTNVVPSSPAFRFFSEGKTMVIGADVSHPGPGVLRPSVAALVSSVDESAAKYVATCSIQEPRLEIIEKLGEMVQHALYMFNKYRSFIVKKFKSGQVPLWPEQIIFYRDGVSEGEIQQVVENEIRQITDAIGVVYTKVHQAPPKITFIVVTKRHHVRFIPKRREEADKSGNAPAGFVVDEGITSPGIFDFYLQSHAGLLGTSRPSHYIVVKDDNNFDADTLQGFSFTLCHTYARATRSVSIPAPCYYADIACARADFHFDPDLNFADDLSSDGGNFDMEKWRKGFKGVHRSQQTNMYFM